MTPTSQTFLPSIVQLVRGESGDLVLLPTWNQHAHGGFLRIDCEQLQFGHHARELRAVMRQFLVGDRRPGRNGVPGACEARDRCRPGSRTALALPRRQSCRPRGTWPGSTGWALCGVAVLHHRIDPCRSQVFNGLSEAFGRVVDRDKLRRCASVVEDHHRSDPLSKPIRLVKRTTMSRNPSRSRASNTD